MARAQAQNSHSPTSEPVPPTKVSPSLESLSGSGPTPWNHPDSSLIPRIQPGGKPLTPLYLCWPPRFSLSTNTILPYDLRICCSLCLKLCITWVKGRLPPTPFRSLLQMPSPQGGLLQASLLVPPALSFLECLPLPDSLHVLTGGSRPAPSIEHKLREGRLSRSLLYPST